MDLRRLCCAGLCACGAALVALEVPSLRFMLASQAGLAAGRFRGKHPAPSKQHSTAVVHTQCTRLWIRKGAAKSCDRVKNDFSNIRSRFLARTPETKICCFCERRYTSFQKILGVFPDLG